MSQNQIGISSWVSSHFSSQNFFFRIDTQFTKTTAQFILSLGDVNNWANKGQFAKNPSLQPGEVPLPPEVPLHARPQRGEEVVAVHEDVDGGVDDGGGHGRTTGLSCNIYYIIFIFFNIKYHHVCGGDPVHEEDGAVVVDVQEGHVAVLAPQEEEYCVLKILFAVCHHPVQF